MPLIQELPPIQIEPMATEAAKRELSRTPPVSEESVIQIGDIWPSARASHPYGLLCDGSEYAAADYAALYAEIGQTFGGSEGTFRVPNVTSRHLSGGTVGAVVGSNSVDFEHTHGVDIATDTATAHSHESGDLATANAGGHGHSLTGSTNTVEAHTHGMSHTHQIDPPETESEPTNDTGLLGGSLLVGDTAEHTHNVDIPEFTSGASSAGSTGSGGDHDHSVTGTTSSQADHAHGMSGATAAAGSHSHAVDGDTASALTTHDNRPESLCLNFFIRWK